MNVIDPEYNAVPVSSCDDLAKVFGTGFLQDLIATSNSKKHTILQFRVNNCVSKRASNGFGKLFICNRKFTSLAEILPYLTEMSLQMNESNQLIKFIMKSINEN